ncbi:MAG: hypothetical protein A6D92_06820 [Symbiobacterium thermophilum]|uniref:L-seryl-tRNA selenium transferase N-terminal domain-containing protein n=1 Tax=Symbiobacterium thermophilum TaxID=2734 RepID=A0A1Y2T4W1_SYMTR|nr:MAG: hypothetical protein A6D92_06820 [Symbiobacterium thermophilum]
MAAAALRAIPPVNEILETPTGQRLLAERARALVVDAVGEALDALRRKIAAAASEEELAPWTALRRGWRPRPRRASRGGSGPGCAG